MKHKFYSILSIIVIGTSSCSTITKITTRNNKVDYVKTISPITYPVVMDLNIDLTKKAKGNSTGPINFQLTEEYYKEQALSSAIIMSGCDVLIDPVFLVTKTNISKSTKKQFTIEVEVTGYPAKYMNPRNFEMKDTSIVKLLRETKIENKIVPINTESKKTIKIF